MAALATISQLLSLVIAPRDDFADFYESHYPRLAGSIRAVCGDDRLAEEIAQEAFARALVHWDRLRLYDKPAGWIYRTAFNLLRRHWKKKGISEELGEPSVVSPPEEAGRLDVMEMLAPLPYRQRQAVVLRHVLDYSTNDVAAIMEVTPGALRMILHRAVESLRAHHGISLSIDEDGQ